MRRTPVRNLVRAVVTLFPGDPWGERIAAPLAADIGNQLAGRSGTIIAGATNASAGTAFTGYTPGGIRVPTVRATIPMARNSAAMFHSSVSDQQEAYRSILAARLARDRATR